MAHSDRGSQRLTLRKACLLAACLVTAGCASSFPTPTQSLADAQSAERSASELGAASQPKAHAVTPLPTITASLEP